MPPEARRVEEMGAWCVLKEEEPRKVFRGIERQVVWASVGKNPPTRASAVREL